MNIEDIIISPKKIETQPWQLGSVITNEIPENGILLVFCNDYRGGKGNAVAKNFDTVREEFYKLSKFDFEIPICDLGDLISGKSLQDTHFLGYNFCLRSIVCRKFFRRVCIKIQFRLL